MEKKDNKEGIIVTSNKVVLKYINEPNVKETLDKIKSELNDVLNEYLFEFAYEVYKQDFPVEFENEVGKWKMCSNGDTYFYPKTSIQYINFTIKKLSNLNEKND